MLRFIAGLSIFTLLSCTHKKMEDKYLVQSDLAPQSCLKELEDSKRDSIDQVFDVVVNGTQSGVSYLLSGAGYTTDFVIVAVGGLAVGVVICSPIIALEGSLRGSGRASGECVGNVSGNIWKEFPEKGIGGTLYESTESLRCPEVDYISKGLRNVSSCYKSKGMDNYALEQVQAIESDPVLKKCSSETEKEKVQRLLEELQS